MHSALTTLIGRLAGNGLTDAAVIPWSSPVPAFGDLMTARVASVGLNPSNREFLSLSGGELDGPARRFHTLRSLGIKSWEEVDARHLRMIMDSCRLYFSRNPYDSWFRRLDQVVAGTMTSYYDVHGGACHLDLVPYATQKKWTELTRQQRSLLLSVAGDALGLLLREAPIRVLILNGRSVITNFQKMTGVHWASQKIDKWSLRRGPSSLVPGFAFTGIINRVANVRLEHDVFVLGFNHNLQSSFGITRAVIAAIRHWVRRNLDDWP
jgi:hypothetical protein